MCGCVWETDRTGGWCREKVLSYENIDYTFLRVHSLRRVLISRNARKILLAHVRELLGAASSVSDKKILTGNIAGEVSPFSRKDNRFFKDILNPYNI